MVAAGNTTTHQRTRMGLSDAAPSARRDPQLAAGACTPNPRKLRNDSSMTTAGIVRVK